MVISGAPLLRCLRPSTSLRDKWLRAITIDGGGREFLDFMNQIVAAYPDRDLHVVLDNLNTHKPKEDRWLKRHPRVHSHFIPTYSSWLNQVECWFSILAQQALKGVSFTSPTQLREAIDEFVKAYNQKAAPFEWIKAVVHPMAPKQKYADFCN